MKASPAQRRAFANQVVRFTQGEPLIPLHPSQDDNPGTVWMLVVWGLLMVGGMVLMVAVGR